MDLDYETALHQASHLASYAEDLCVARNRMMEYRETIMCMWQGKEVESMILSIDQTIDQHNRLNAQLRSLSEDIRTTAREIKAEEEARRRRIAACEQAVAESEEHVRDAEQRYSEIETRLNDAEGDEVTVLQDELAEADRQRSEAHEEYDRCVRALDEARR